MITKVQNTWWYQVSLKILCHSKSWWVCVTEVDAAWGLEGSECVQNWTANDAPAYWGTLTSPMRHRVSELGVRSRAANKKTLWELSNYGLGRVLNIRQVWGRPKEFQWFEYIIWLHSTQKISFNRGSKLLMSCPVSGNPIIKKGRDQLFMDPEYSGFSNYYCGLLTHETIAFI